MTRKAMAAAVLAVLMGLGAGVWLGRARPLEVREAQTQAALGQRLDGDLALSAQHLVESRRDVDAVEQRLCEQVSAGHWPGDPLQMLETLKDLATSSGVSRPEVTIGKEEASPFDCGVGLVQTHFSLKGRATFQQARALFDTLNSQRFLLRPADIRLDAQGSDGGLAQLTIDVVYTQFRSPR